MMAAVFIITYKKYIWASHAHSPLGNCQFVVVTLSELVIMGGVLGFS